jgi:Zn-dependent peptidase ImmA (M78 family)
MDALLRGKRQIHPELRHPLTWGAVQAVCRREGVLIKKGPLPADAVLLAALGSAVIVLNSDLPPRRHTYRAAHELAHWWLHSDRELTIYRMSEDVRDEREDEAEYIALRLMQGW